MFRSLKELIVYLALAGALIGTACFVAGCASTTPQVVAYKTTAGTITTADQAIAAWADYVVAKRKANAAIVDPLDRAAAQAALLNQEGKVSAAYYDYQKAAIAAVKAGAVASSLGGTNTPSSGDVAAATVNLITIVTQLIH